MDEGDEEIVTSEGQKLDDDGRCFLGDVYGRLPFKQFETAPSFEYSGILMDEERLIGILVSYIAFETQSVPQAHKCGLERWS